MSVCEKRQFDTQRTLMGSFNFETHKKVFENCLEVIIDEKGVVHYAYPSHLEWLTRYAMNRLAVNRQQLRGLCPGESFVDMIPWLCRITGCVAVWNGRTAGKVNRSQLITLNRLRKEGLYKG